MLSEYVVKIAPSTYYAFKKRSADLRQLRDEELCAEIERVYHDRDEGPESGAACKV